MDAKTELILNHFTHALDQAVKHFTAAGDTDALMDIRRMVEATVDAALARAKPFRKLEQEVIADPETGRVIG